MSSFVNRNKEKRISIMWLIIGLNFTLSIILLINMIMSPFISWLKPKDTQQKSSEDKKQWTWKDTIWVIIMMASCLLLLYFLHMFSSYFYVKIIYAIILIFAYALQLSNVLPSTKLVGAIVSGKSKGNLNRNEYWAIIALAVLALNIFVYGVSGKIFTFIATYSNLILSDWMMIAFYILSISVFVFLICSLAITPVKFLLRVSSKVYSCLLCGKIKSYINKPISKLRAFITGNFSMKTCAASIIEYSLQERSVFKPLLWVLVVPAVAVDIIRNIFMLSCQIIAFIVWCGILIFKQICEIANKIRAWIISLSDSSVIAISFRVAIILGFGGTVVLNNYQPFLHNQEQSGVVLEFISSVLIIPVILEWFLSRKRVKKEAEK